MRSKLAIWSFVLSLIPYLFIMVFLLQNYLIKQFLPYFLLIFLVFYYKGIFLIISVASIILAINSIRKIRLNPNLKGKGLAITALILSIIILVLLLIFNFISCGNLIDCDAGRLFNWLSLLF